jgi:hypothetical protein
MPTRRFPPPWSIEERQACFIVKDGNGLALAFIYFEDEPGRRSAAKVTHTRQGVPAAQRIRGRPRLQKPFP